MVLTSFFLLSWGGARLSPLGRSATNWAIAPASDDRWRMWCSRWSKNWQGKPKYSEKTCPSATLFTTNPTWLDLGSNPGRSGGKPETNRLSYGAAIHATSFFIQHTIIITTDSKLMCPIESQSLDIERSGRGLISRTLSVTGGQVWGHIRNPSVSIVGIPVEIRTEYVPNAIQKRHRLSQLGPCPRVLTLMAFPIAHCKADLRKKRGDKYSLCHAIVNRMHARKIFTYFVEIRHISLSGFTTITSSIRIWRNTPQMLPWKQWMLMYFQIFPSI
jgi:hypothetical protein